MNRLREFVDLAIACGRFLVGIEEEPESSRVRAASGRMLDKMKAGILHHEEHADECRRGAAAAEQRAMFALGVGDEETAKARLREKATAERAAELYDGVAAQCRTAVEQLGPQLHLAAARLDVAERRAADPLQHPFHGKILPPAHRPLLKKIENKRMEVANAIVQLKRTERAAETHREELAKWEARLDNGEFATLAPRELLQEIRGRARVHQTGHAAAQADAATLHRAVAGGRAELAELHAEFVRVLNLDDRAGP